jgi:CRP/FNR family cyclic AMP-dependent transcriptional regulator
MKAVRESMIGDANPNPGAGEFLGRLTPLVLKDLRSIKFPVAYREKQALFVEKEPAGFVFLILRGEVKLSINSGEGRRLGLSIAREGDILGLASVLAGGCHDMTAETRYPSVITSLLRQEFLDFLSRHPEVYQPVTEVLSRYVRMMGDQLRSVGLSCSAPQRVARVLLEWNEGGQMTSCGMRCHFYLTHSQIAEFAGVSRETVTRTLGTFRNLRLLSFDGTTLTIPNRQALETYASSQHR